jgi:UDP-N-acetylglucosamine:LPS N-acetylglucosamine transferase
MTTAAAPDAAQPARRPRVLILTASVGEGHNTAATSLSSWLGHRSPGPADVRVIDMLARTRARGTLLPRLYQLSVQALPLGYELWYQAVASLDWCHRYYREVAAARWAAVLGPELERERPDIVITTHPLCTAAVARLRRRALTDVPLVAFLTDFAPHRFWVYPGVDRYLVFSEQAREAVRRMDPEAAVSVSPPAVDRGFHPFPPVRQRLARARLDLPADRLVVLVSAGSRAMGSLRDAVSAVREAGGHAVVTCGRNRRLLSSLRRTEGGDGISALGWVDDMAELFAACDVVVNNAGGATAAEALACGRALVMFRPIAGHGRACARMLSEVGLAPTCTDRRELTGLLASWAGDPEALRCAQ